ncbi:hypothetical protein Tco_0496863 [Tanacetum coccineum]
MDIQDVLKKKGSKVEERLVQLRMEVRFEVLIEKKKMYYLGLRRFDLWTEFLMMHLDTRIVGGSLFQSLDDFTSEDLIFENINLFLMTDATNLTFSINLNRRDDVLNRRKVGLIWTIRRDTICQLIKSPSIGEDTRALTRNVKNLSKSFKRVGEELILNHKLDKYLTFVRIIELKLTLKLKNETRTYLFIYFKKTVELDKVE